MDELRAALTAEEWDRFPDIAAGGQPTRGEEPLYHHTRHGIAAANLHGQPFGFTWEDVDRLWEAVSLADEHMTGPITAGESLGARLSLLADRIAALLPPREG